MSGTRKPTALAAGLAGLALLIGGCGGSSSPTVAHLSTAKASSEVSSAGSGPSPESSPNSLGLAALDYTKCMRTNGVPNFPEPKPGGGFMFHAGAGLDPSSPAFSAAQAKCRKLMPGGGPPTSTNPSPQTLARFLKIAQCMRRHGVPDFPDPRTSVPSNPLSLLGSGGGVISDIEEVIFVFPAAIDQSSPTFKQAAAACAFPLHNH